LIPASRWAGALALSTCALAAAQEGPPTQATPTPAPATPAATQLDKVEVRGARESETEERRRSTASKIIVGRDEIERYGDSTVGEILRRLPGVTMQGAPGRGGRIAMRGMGSYTQILVDGQRVPPGFSIDSLNPEQIERIEILRAPTAETGTRAIAGTINIITREGFVRRLNELALNIGWENERLQPGLSWTRNDTMGRWIYNGSLSVNRFDQKNDSVSTTTDTNLTTGQTTLAQVESSQGTSDRTAVSATGRLQYRLDNGMLILAPFLLRSQGGGETLTELTQPIGSTPPPYARSATDRDGVFSLARLNLQSRHRLASGLRLETRGTLSQGVNEFDSVRREFDSAAALSRVFTDDGRTRNTTAEAAAKLSYDLMAGHALVGGVELEGTNRSDNRRSLQDGQPVDTGFGESLEARVRRAALYAQDEWTPSKRWSAYAGLRWEGIETTGETGAERPSNRSSVFSPLAHAVFKPDAESRNQLRMSLTRSYRSPDLGSLIARPAVSRRFPVDQPNQPTSPDFAGNPALKPELATGIELAAERYLPSGGMLSANLFYRDISNLIRAQTTLELVPWSSVPRWVRRPQNIGDASTAGLELEARVRLNELMAEAPRVDLHANASVFRSRVDSVPEPDNRLDQQPDFTLNAGADYRFRAVPLTIGGNVNLTPAYDTRVSAEETAEQGRKRLIDLYAQWTFNPQWRLRFTVSNVAPLDYVTGNSILVDPATVERQRSVQSSYVAYRLRLEARL
jgi:iron complex outermembrane receptor protein